MRLLFSIYNSLLSLFNVKEKSIRVIDGAWHLDGTLGHRLGTGAQGAALQLHHVTNPEGGSELYVDAFGNGYTDTRTTSCQCPDAPWGHSLASQGRPSISTGGPNEIRTKEKGLGVREGEMGWESIPRRI